MIIGDFALRSQGCNLKKRSQRGGGGLRSEAMSERVCYRIDALWWLSRNYVTELRRNYVDQFFALRSHEWQSEKTKPTSGLGGPKGNVFGFRRGYRTFGDLHLAKWERFVPSTKGFRFRLRTGQRIKISALLVLAGGVEIG